MHCTKCSNLFLASSKHLKHLIGLICESIYFPVLLKISTIVVYHPTIKRMNGLKKISFRQIHNKGSTLSFLILAWHFSGSLLVEQIVLLAITDDSRCSLTKNVSALRMKKTAFEIQQASHLRCHTSHIFCLIKMAVHFTERHDFKKSCITTWPQQLQRLTRQFWCYSICMFHPNRPFSLHHVIHLFNFMQAGRFPSEALEKI